MKAIGNVGVFQFFAHANHRGDCQCPAKAGRHAIGEGLGEIIATFHHKQRTTQDSAVYRDQRQENAQRIVKWREVLIENHLKNL